MSVDTSPERLAIREIDGGLKKILNGIRRLLSARGVPYDKIEESMLDFQAGLTLDVDEIVTMLDLGSEYRAYLTMLASCEE